MPRARRIDPPLTEFDVTDDHDGTIYAVFADQPGIRWAYWCIPSDDETEVVIRSITATDPTVPFLLDALPALIPRRRLTYWWHRAMEPGFNPATVLEPRELPWRPDRRLQDKDPEEYARRFHEWAAPIAEEVRRAQYFGEHRHEYLSRVFKVSKFYAETLVQLAREAGHDLPYLRPPKAEDDPPPVKPIRTGRPRSTRN